MSRAHPRLGGAIVRGDGKGVAEEYEKWKEERRKQKEILKASESVEEKRKRRLAKKEVKEKKRLTELGWDEEYMGYTNRDNPFNDPSLLKPFKWSKKTEKEKAEEDAEIHRKELERVKHRRAEWEKERAELDREKEAHQRMKEAEFYKEWERQEDRFHLQQAKIRSDIRIKDQRAKPIDYLAKYICAEDDDSAIELHEPYLYLNGLCIEDLEDLLEDIKTYTELEEGKNADYWRDITTVAKDELSKLKKLDPRGRDITGDRRESINKAVSKDVTKSFETKTLAQLQLLGKQIRNKLTGGGEVDVGYWESVLDQLDGYMARQRLRERHQQVLRAKYVKLKQEQGIDEPLFPSAVDGDQPSTSKEQPNEPSESVSSDEEDKEKKEEKREEKGQDEEDKEVEEGEEDEEDEDEDEEKMPSRRKKTQEEIEAEQEAELKRWESWDPEAAYEEGRYSPKLLDASQLAIDDVIEDPEDDIGKLAYQREMVLNQGKNVKMGRDDEFERKAREGMDDDEAQFSVEVPMEQQRFLWSDKYKPRKPRFFNRVHTGWEWNKYNQTHYDLDNPPPKVVQGYKFSIFYPDLIDKSKSPEYTLTTCRDDPNYCVLRFKAGAPYEDIGFKIVSREWDTSHRHGFRCQFNNGIFQLWFHFKKFRYRR